MTIQGQGHTCIPAGCDEGTAAGLRAGSRRRQRWRGDPHSSPGADQPAPCPRQPRHSLSSIAGLPSVRARCPGPAPRWHHAAPAAAGSSPRGSRALSRNPNLSSEQTTLSTCLQLSQPLCQVGEEGMQFGARHCCTSLRNVGSETGDAWDCKEQLQPVLLRLIPTSEPTGSS